MPLDLTTQNIIISSVFGSIAGGIVSLIAPWTHWGIEKRRKKLERKKKLIDECKAYLDAHHFNSSFFLEKSCYTSLRPYFNEELILKLESDRIQLRAGSGRGSGANNFKSEILDELAKIENKWKLV